MDTHNTYQNNGPLLTYNDAYIETISVYVMNDHAQSMDKVEFRQPEFGHLNFDNCGNSTVISATFANFHYCPKFHGITTIIDFSGIFFVDFPAKFRQYMSLSVVFP